jgi:RHS repeat-associated protein
MSRVMNNRITSLNFIYCIWVILSLLSFNYSYSQTPRTPTEHDIVTGTNPNIFIPCNEVSSTFSLLVGSWNSSSGCPGQGTDIKIFYTVMNDYSAVKGQSPFATPPTDISNGNEFGVDYHGCSNLSCNPSLDVTWNPNFTGIVRINVDPTIYLTSNGCGGDNSKNITFYIYKEGSNAVFPSVSINPPSIINGQNITIDYALVDGGLSYSTVNEVNVTETGSSASLGSASITNPITTYPYTGSVSFTSSNSYFAIGSNTMNVSFNSSCSATASTYGPYSTNVTIYPTCSSVASPSLTVTDASGNAITQQQGFGYILSANTTYRLYFGGYSDLNDYVTYDNGGGNVTWTQFNGNYFTTDASGNLYAEFSINPSPAVAGLYNIGAQLKSSIASSSSASYYNSCQNPSVQVGIGGGNQTITSKCLITIPQDLETSNYVVNYSSSNQNVLNTILNLSVFSYTVQSNVGVIVNQGVTLSEGAHLIVNYVPPVNTAEAADLANIWTQQTIYDETGAPYADSRQYIDGAGNPYQIQYKNFGGNVVLAMQTLYDQYWRPVIKTLPAPVRTYSTSAGKDACGNQIPGFGLFYSLSSSFVAADAEGTAYAASNFENTSASNQKRTSPDPVADAGDGTLGRYYGGYYTVSSTSAYAEPYAPKTSYPYIRTYAEDIGSSTNYYNTLPGDEHVMGQGHVVTTSINAASASSITGPTGKTDTDLLTSYLNIYKVAAIMTPLSSPPHITDGTQILRQVTTDTEGNQTVKYSDTGGKTIATRYVPTEDWSFNFYDLKGRIVYQVSPNGVSIFNTTNPTALTGLDMTTSTCNFRGDLLQKTTADGGTSNFMYRTDGQIRFSQSAVQAAAIPHRFSYTEYDALARPVESGEYTLANANTNYQSFGYGNTYFMALLDATGSNGVIDASTAPKGNVIKVHYDGDGDPTSTPTPLPSDFVANFVVGRVSSTERTDNGYQTFYSYDDLGRVTYMVQNIPGLGQKTINYSYGQYGKVTKVDYQKGQLDGFSHFYTYDLSGRLLTVSSQTNAQLNSSVNPQAEVNYSYYLHGPLKQESLVPGLSNEQDRFYTYTPQGWLKSINHLSDPTASTSKALFHEKLDYFTQDYGYTSATYPTLYYPNGLSDQRYNGIPVGITYYNTAQACGNYSAFSHTYDSKYQLRASTYGTVAIDSRTSQANITLSTNKQYAETVSGYDANGNISGLARYDGSGSNLYPYFGTYSYTTNTNSLASISDGAKRNPNIDRTYTYDAIGRVTQEVNNTGGYTFNMTYDPMGLVTNVTKLTASTNKTNKLQDISYSDAGGRFKQVVYDANGGDILETYYVNDMEGNVIAVYEYNPTDPNPTIQLAELPILGLSRIGNVMVTYANNNTNYGYYYELTDHLGNVRVVFDRTSQSGSSAIPTVHYYSDYYAFGLPIINCSSQGYRYGYQGQDAEYDQATTKLYSFYWRQYDAEIGRWKATDPAGQFWSPYMGMGNSPVIGSDPDGTWSWHDQLSFFENIYGNLKYAFSGESFTFVDREGAQFNFGDSKSKVTIKDYQKQTNIIDVPQNSRGQWPTYSTSVQQSGNRTYKYKFKDYGSTGSYIADYSNSRRYLGQNKIKNIAGSSGSVDISITPDPNSEWNSQARENDKTGTSFNGNQGSYGFGDQNPVVIQKSKLTNPIMYRVHHYGFFGLGTYYTNGNKVVGRIRR